MARRMKGETSNDYAYRVADMVATRDNRIRDLELALRVAQDALRNDFEPDNQSRAYKVVTAALENTKGR